MVTLSHLTLMLSHSKWECDIRATQLELVYSAKLLHITYEFHIDSAHGNGVLNSVSEAAFQANAPALKSPYPNKYFL